MRVLLILAVLLTGCGGAAASPTPSGHDISGTFALHAQRGNFAPNCAGGGGYDDIRSGMGLTLRDGDGSILGTARLGSGHASEDRKLCLFDFEFSDVPDADFYAVEAGRRGEQAYSFDDMEAADWKLALEIGG